MFDYFQIDISLFRIRPMAFRLHLVFVYIALHLLLINSVTSNVLQQSEVIIR